VPDDQDRVRRAQAAENEELMMSKDLQQRRGMYFEEFEINQRITSPARTITETDILSFAGLTGDFNSIHTDTEFARETAFGQRVAHGLLGMSIASGLATRTGVLEGTVLAFREIENWKFSQPVFIGDTLHALLEVIERKALPRLGGGSLTLDVRVLNQRQQTVMRGRWNMLVQSRPPG
jgi:3-hydroxybutyryl-CoA dehydratase